MRLRKSPYRDSIDLGKVNTEHALAIAVLACLTCGYHIQHLNKDSLVAFTPFTWKSVSEEIRIQIRPTQELSFSSECRSFQIVDWGKNKQNFRAFKKAYRLYDENSSLEVLSRLSDEISLQTSLDKIIALAEQTS